MRVPRHVRAGTPSDAAPLPLRLGTPLPRAVRVAPWLDAAVAAVALLPALLVTAEGAGHWLLVPVLAGLAIVGALAAQLAAPATGTRTAQLD